MSCFAQFALVKHCSQSNKRHANWDSSEETYLIMFCLHNSNMLGCVFPGPGWMTRMKYECRLTCRFTPEKERKKNKAIWFIFGLKLGLEGFGFQLMSILYPNVVTNIQDRKNNLGNVVTDSRFVTEVYPKKVCVLLLIRTSKWYTAFLCYFKRLKAVSLH